MKHLFYRKGINKECVHWDLHTNYWTTKGSSTISSNDTHTTCSFQYLSTYAVMERPPVQEEYNLQYIIIISVTVGMLVFILFSIMVVCFNRLKVVSCGNEEKDYYDS